LAQAKSLALSEKLKPKQASLRRSISTAYYALYHFLTEQATSEFVSGKGFNTQLRHMAARSVAHSRVKEVCKQFEKDKVEQMSEILRPMALRLGFAGDADVRIVTEALIRLQEERHNADYNLGATFSREDALSHVKRCEDAFKAWHRWRQSDSESARFFMLCLLLWAGLAGRN
jgi:uncharacterized protein (UPF0332 family)